MAALRDAGLFLAFPQIVLNTLGCSAGMRLLVTGFVIIAVLAAAGGHRRTG